MIVIIPPLTKVVPSTEDPAVALYNALPTVKLEELGTPVGLEPPSKLRALPAKSMVLLDSGEILLSVSVVVGKDSKGNIRARFQIYDRETGWKMKPPSYLILPKDLKEGALGVHIKDNIVVWRVFDKKSPVWRSVEVRQLKAVFKVLS